jgi:5-(carboxyamino)imidazole ribonucleotide synthase
MKNATINKGVIKKIALAFQLVGCFAVEFFLTSSGQLLVNEIAPRVHNSGHYSIDATSASQFKQHWLALAGETSATPKHLPGCSAMLNLLGPPSYQGAIDPPLIQTPCSRVHWYDKSESRPGRKLGHINILANSKEGLMKLVEKVRREIDTWHQDKLNPTLTVQRGANP